MTASEFRDNVTSMGDLEEFLNDNNDDYLDQLGIAWYDGLGEAIDDDINDYVRYSDYGWETLRDYLNDVENMDCGEGWYRKDGSFEYQYLDYEDVDNIINEVYERYVDNGWFDEEDDDEDEEDESCEEESDPEDEIPLEVECVSFAELFSSGVDAISAAREKRIAEENRKIAEENRAFEEMLERTAIAG